MRRRSTRRWPIAPSGGRGTGASSRRCVRRKGFAGALAFVNAVGALAEAADHHPDIDIRWDTVTLRLSTHSAGGLTENDLALAKEIDALG
jgi:4a-hydroxytetrahydrobiopterin dehydratase